MWSRVGNVAVSFALIIIYAYLFGKPSFQRYVKKGIIIIKNKEKTSNIEPPGKFRCIKFSILKLTSYLQGRFTFSYYSLSNNKSVWRMEKWKLHSVQYQRRGPVYWVHWKQYLLQPLQLWRWYWSESFHEHKIYLRW